MLPCPGRHVKAARLPALSERAALCLRCLRANTCGPYPLASSGRSWAGQGKGIAMTEIVTLRRYDTCWEGEPLPLQGEDAWDRAKCDGCGREVIDPAGAWIGTDRAGQIVGFYCPACLPAAAAGTALRATVFGAPVVTVATEEGIHARPSA